MKILISMPAPHTSSRQLPSQTPQSPVTSAKQLLNHPPILLVGPLYPRPVISFSVVLQRSVCRPVISSSSEIDASAPPLPRSDLGSHHSIDCRAPWVEISRLLAGDSSTFLHVPSAASSSSRGLSSPSSFRGGCRVNFCIQSSSAPAHLLPLSFLV